MRLRSDVRSATKKVPGLIKKPTVESIKSTRSQSNKKRKRVDEAGTDARSKKKKLRNTKKVRTRLQITGDKKHYLPDKRSNSPSRDELSTRVQTVLFNSIKCITNDSKEAIESSLNILAETSSKDVYSELLNFLIQCSGTEHKVTSSSFSSLKSLEKAIEALNKVCILSEPSKNYLMLATRNSVPQKKEEKLFFCIWSCWWKAMKKRIFSDDTEEKLLSMFLYSIKSLSRFKLRPLRRVATFSCLQIITILCTNLIETNKKMLLVSKTKSLAGDSHAPLSYQRQFFEDKIMDLFSVIHPDRYRDSDPVIRAICVREFGIWSRKIPEKFLRKSYLEYHNWLMFDKQPFVRSEFLKTLCEIYSRNSTSPAVVNIIKNLRQSLLEIVANETEFTVRIYALTLLIAIAKNGMLDQNNLNSINILIFDLNPKVRRLVSGIFTEFWQENYLNVLLRKLEESNIKITPSIKSSSTIITLCTALMDLSTPIGHNENPDDMNFTDNISGNDESILKDISDLICWFSYKCPVPLPEKISLAQVESAVGILSQSMDGLELNNIVECFETCLKDVKLHVKDGSASSLLYPTPDQELCLVYMMHALVKQTISSKKQIEGPKRDTFYKIVLLSPKIIDRYFTESKPEFKRLLEEFLSLLGHLSNVLMESDTLYKPVMDSIRDLFRKTISEDIIEECSNVLMSLIKKDESKASNIALFFSKKVSDESDEKIFQGIGEEYFDIPRYNNIPENADSEALSVIKDMFNNIVADTLAHTNNLVKSLLGREIPPNIDALQSLYTGLCKIERLLNLSKWDLQSEEELRGETSLTPTGDTLFDNLCYILDYILSVVIPEDEYHTSQVYKYTLTSVVIKSIELIGIDTIWELWDALSKTLSKFIAISPNIELSKMSLKERVRVLRSTLKSDEINSLPEKFIVKSQQLVKITEAVIVGSKCNVPLDIIFRMTAFKTLSSLLMLMNGDSSLIFSSISYVLPQDIREHTLYIFRRAINALAFTKSEWYSHLSAEERDLIKTQYEKRSFTPFYKKEVILTLMKYVSDFSRLVSYDILDESQSVLLFESYGIPKFKIKDKVYDSYPYGLIFPFGSVWDGLTINCSRKIFGVRFSALLLLFLKSDREDAKQRLDAFFSNAFNIFLKAFTRSFKLYETFLVGTDEATVKLTRLVCETIYSWCSVMIEKSELHLLMGTALKCLIKFLHDGLKEMLSLLREYSENESTHKLKLFNFNKGWKMWIAVANSIHQVQEAFFKACSEELASILKQEINAEGGMNPLEWISGKISDMGYDVLKREEWYPIRLFAKYDNTLVAIPG